MILRQWQKVRKQEQLNYDKGEEGRTQARYLFCRAILVLILSIRVDVEVNEIDPDDKWLDSGLQGSKEGAASQFYEVSYDCVRRGRFRAG